MKRTLTGGLVALAVFALPALADNATAPAEAWTPKTFELDNGMEVVVIPDHRAPVVTHMVWYKVGAVDEVSHETYAGLTLEDFERSPFRRYAGSHRDEMDAGQRQAVLTHVIDLGGGWRWTQRAYATRFQRNWYKADRAAGLSGDWVKLGAMLDGDGADSTVAEALSVFRDGEAGQVRLKANNRLYYSRGVETKTAWDGDWNGWRRFEASVRYHADGMDRFQWVDDWTMVSGRLVNPVMGTPGTESNRIEWSRAVAGYARARWARRGWSVIPGLRMEHILAGRDDYGTADVDRTGVELQTRRNVTVAWLPGVGIQKDLGAAWSVFGGLHRGFLPPGSSEDVQPEFAWNQEAGVRWVRPKVEATAVAFAHFGRNLQGSDFASSGGSGDGEVYNGGTTRVTGVETSFQWTNGANPDAQSRWEAGLTYTYTDGRFTSAFDSDYDAWGQVEAGDRLPYLARHQGTARIGWTRMGWSVETSLRHIEGMRTEAGQAPLADVFTVGGSTVVDVTARRVLGNGFGLEVGVRNLTDDVYIASARPAGLRPGMPRTLTGGFNLSF